MVTVAIAGATGNVGRTIKDALKGNSKHNVILLARKATGEKDESIPEFVIDFNDIDAISEVLKSNNVHTLISTLRVITPDAGQAEVNLVKAAAKSGVTKRFVVSDWGVLIPDDANLQLPQHQLRRVTMSELRQTNLEWTLFHNGYFLDYYGIPHLDSYMTPITFVVDMPNKIAAIPGTGNEPVALTYTKDLAKFVVAALDLPKWDELTFCYSDKVTWNEFIKQAEEATGSKFNVTYDDAEKLSKGEVTELPGHVADYAHLPKQMLQLFFSKFGLFIIAGMFDIPEDKALNRVFPEIKTTKVKDVVSLWKGK